MISSATARCSASTSANATTPNADFSPPNAKQSRMARDISPSSNDSAVISRLTAWREAIQSCSSTPAAHDAAPIVCSFGAFVLAFDLHRDCLQRRLVFELSEQIVWLVLQQSAFGRKARAVDETIVETLAAIWRRFHRDDEKIVFSDVPWWFGGASKRPRSTRAREMNAVKYAGFVIATAYFLTSTSSAELHIPQSELRVFLSRLASRFSSTHAFLQSLIEHDERCLTVIVALLGLQQVAANVCIPDLLCPRLLVLNLLFEIDYDEKVMLDWLQSESVAIAFVMRFARDFAEHLNAYRTLSRTRMCECARLSRARRRAVAIAMPSQAADDDVCLKIVEMIGEERRVRDVRVSRHEERFIESQLPAHCDDSNATDSMVDYMEKTLDCLIRFRLKMQRLAEANLAPFNLSALIAAIERVEERMEDTE